MIDRLKRFFGLEPDEGPDAAGATPFHDIHVATCALLLEIAHIDGEFSEAEQEIIMNTLTGGLGVTEEDSLALMDAAREEIKKSIDLWHFTNLINERYTQEEKVRIMETVWKVIYADGLLEKHEDYLVHSLAKLLRLSHRQLIDAKLKAKESAAQ